MLNHSDIKSLKMIRDNQLQKTDKCMFEDFEIKGEKISLSQKTEILKYRKDLKDLPEKSSECNSFEDVVFPECPKWLFI